MEMKRIVIVAGAALVTAASLTLALFLGSWGYDQRRFSLHEGRLRRLVERAPHRAQVVEGLRREESVEIGAARGEAEMVWVADRWGQGRRGLVLEKGRRWPEVRVFQAADMVYFLYFDDEGVLKDFVCVSR